MDFSDRMKRLVEAIYKAGRADMPLKNVQQAVALAMVGAPINANPTLVTVNEAANDLMNNINEGL